MDAGLRLKASQDSAPTSSHDQSRRSDWCNGAIEIAISIRLYQNVRDGITKYKRDHSRWGRGES